MTGAGPPGFIADCMLGKLARWLRILGFDAVYERGITDDDLIARARAENRVLLTRDTRLVLRRALPRHLLIESQDPDAQLRQVLSELGLEASPAGLLTRCSVCNVVTRPIAREEARAAVPPYVFETQPRFARCPVCRRVYWRATHVEGIERKLADSGVTENGAAEGDGEDRRTP